MLTPDVCIGIFLPLVFTAGYVQWQKRLRRDGINKVMVFTTIFYGLAVTAVCGVHCVLLCFTYWPWSALGAYLSVRPAWYLVPSSWRGHGNILPEHFKPVGRRWSGVAADRGPCWILGHGEYYHPHSRVRLTLVSHRSTDCIAPTGGTWPSASCLLSARLGTWVRKPQSAPTLIPYDRNPVSHHTRKHHRSYP